MCIRMGSIRQAFCKLYMNVAISDCGVLANFAFYVAPMIMSQSEAAHYRVTLVLTGGYHVFMWCVSVFSTLSLALNRLVAVTSPLRYNDIYTGRNIKLNICAVYGISFFYSIWFSLPNCEFSLDPAHGTFYYADSQCGYLLDSICSTVCCVIFVVILFLNIYTAVCMRRQTKKIETSGQTAATKKRKRQETTFLLQSCINSGVFQFMTLGFHAFARLEVPFFPKFFMKTILWQMAHTVNGVVFSALNEDFRHEIRSIVKHFRSPIGVQPAFYNTHHYQSEMATLTPVLIGRSTLHTAT